MAINFAAITPHPPILVPEVGGKEAQKIKKTRKAMEKLAEDLNKAEPDALIVISPHGLVYPDKMNICGMPKLSGNLAQFGAPQVSLKFDNNLDLAKKIVQKCQQQKVDTILYDNGTKNHELDHGIIVPLYFLIQKLERSVRVLPITYSFLDRQIHFKFGEILAEILTTMSDNVAIIASGDLSHRLLPSSPAGYSIAGKKFDEKLIQYLKSKNTKGILNLDGEFVERAGECGLRSILILLGALSGLNYKTEVLSYEGPFGVGYLVTNFKLGVL